MTILYFDEGNKNPAVHLGFRWQRIPRLQNTVGPSRFFLSFDLAHCKDFCRDPTVSYEYRDVCKSKFWCILMVEVKLVYIAF